MQRKLVIKLIIILTVFIVVGVLSFMWIRQQPAQLDPSTEVCIIKS